MVEPFIVAVKVSVYGTDPSASTPAHARKTKTRHLLVSGFYSVDRTGLEPVTSSMPWMRSTR